MARHNNNDKFNALFFDKVRPRWMVKKSHLERLGKDAKELNVSVNVLLECIIAKELANG